MSFDLAREQINQRIASMPLTQSIDPGVFDNFAFGTGMATMRGFAWAARAGHLVGSVAPILQDVAQDALFGTGTKNQDAYFAEHEAIFKRATDYWTPRPGEVGVAGEVVGSLLSTLPMVIANPAAAVAQFQLSQAEQFVDAGAGAARANIASIGMGAGFAAGIWMPILGQNLWQRMLVGGAGANVAQGILTRGFAGQLLEGHVTEGAAPTAFNLADITTDALLGLAFGSLAHVSPGQREQGARAWTQIRNWAEGFKPSEVDALAVLRLGQHKNADSAPGIPRTPQDIEVQVQRMNEAIRALVNDEQVNVQGIGKPEVIPSPVDNSGLVPSDETAPSVADIHRLAEEQGMAWDNDPAFMDLTEQVTGKRHLDELDPTERVELARHIAGEVATPETAQEAPGSTRTVPPEFTPRPEGDSEAQAIVANLRAAADEMARDYDLPPPVRPIEEHPVYKAVKGQLDKMERVTPEQADAYARLHTAFYNAMAKRTGRSVDDLLAAHPVRVTGDAPPVGALEQDGRAPIFYSALERQLTAAKMEQAPAKGWKDFIRGLQQKGVKPDEVKWSGIEEWLDAQPGKVTKAEVVEFLKAGGVKVEEVLAGGKQQTTPDDEAVRGDIEKLGELGFGLVDDEGTWFFHDRETGETIDASDIGGKRRQAAIENRHDDAIRFSQAYVLASHIETYLSTTANDATKFSTYQLPGGENYRELLLTLPVSRSSDALEARANELLDQQERQERLLAAAQRNGDINGITSARQEMQRLYAEVGQIQRQAGQETGVFRSSHFDTPNVLAHIRFNERVDADGKRVLFVEEFQSDWAQAGKKKGFADPARAAQIDAELLALSKDRDPVTNMMRDEPRWHALMNERDRLSPSNVPAAPFVGKTDAWVALAVKRVIRYAAEHGFERVAWTTGEQQVQRYSSALRKAVDSIEWEKTPEGIHIVGYKGKSTGRPMDDGAGGVVHVNPYREAMLDAINRNDLLGFDESAEARQAILAHGDFADRWDIPPEDAAILKQWREAQLAPKERQKVVDTRQREDELSDAIGKSMAERIINDPNQKGTIEGEAINISDTGMAGFYDRIVPKVVKEVLRQLDKTAKVGELKFAGSFDDVGAYEMRERRDGGWILVDRSTGQRATDSPTFRSGGDAEKWIQEHTQSAQQGFEITPEMRTAAMAGQALFQDSAAGARGYMATDETGARTIGLLAGADPSTFIHESGHFFLDTMADLAADKAAPAELRADMGKIMEWFGVKPEAWDAMGIEERRPYHEQFARGFELYTMEGKAPAPELRGIFQRFRDWLLDVYKALTELNVQVSDPIRAVFDRMLTGKRAEEAAGAPVRRDFTDPDMQRMVQQVVYNEAGWAQIGGKLDIGRLVREHGPDAVDASGRPTISGVAFTEWIPKADWWRDRPDKKLNEEGYRKAVEKAVAGKPLRAIEQRAIDFLVELVNKRDAAVKAVGEDEWGLIGRDLLAEEEAPTTQNVTDAHEVANAMAIDEAAVERAALQHEDDAAFMAEIRRINATGQTTEGGQADSGQAPGRGGPADRQEPGADGPGNEPAGDGSEPPSALSVAADTFVNTNPERPLRVGTNADGTPVTMTARQYLEAARAAHEQALQDAPLFEAAAQCYLLGGTP